jgi:hypothetical protein
MTEPIDLLSLDKAKLVARVAAVEGERDRARKGKDFYGALLDSSEARIGPLMKLLPEAANSINEGSNAGLDPDLRARIDAATAESAKAELAKIVACIDAVEGERDQARNARDKTRALLNSSEDRRMALMNLLREAANWIDGGSDAGLDLRARIGTATAESIKTELEHVEGLKALVNIFRTAIEQGAPAFEAESEKGID